MPPLPSPPDLPAATPSDEYPGARLSNPPCTMHDAAHPRGGVARRGGSRQQCYGWGCRAAAIVGS